MRESVYVQLTPEGLSKLERYLSKQKLVVYGHNGGSKEEVADDYLVGGNTYRFRMNHLMHIFGGPDLKDTPHPFVDDKIYTEPPE